MLSRLQELLLLALREPDPRAYLQTVAASDAGLSDSERACLLAIEDDGLRLTRMLIRKLRMQRIVRGDPDAAALLAEDPERFAACFARYDQEQPWTHVFPRDEARAFRRYC